MPKIKIICYGTCLSLIFPQFKIDVHDLNWSGNFCDFWLYIMVWPACISAVRWWHGLSCHPCLNLLWQTIRKLFYSCLFCSFEHFSEKLTHSQISSTPKVLLSLTNVADEISMWVFWRNSKKHHNDEFCFCNISALKL